MLTSVTQEKPVIEALVASGRLTHSQLELAQYHQRVLAASGQNLSTLDVIVRDGFCARETIARLVGTADYVAGMHRALLPQDICRRYQVMPVRVDHQKLVVRAAAPLTDGQRQVLIRQCSEHVTDILIQATDRLSVQRAMEHFYQEEALLSDCLDRMRREEPTHMLVHSTVNALLTEALDKSASDIHIDFIGDENSGISFRIDGELVRQYLLPRRVVGPLLMRLKTLCGMDAADNRRPQDGRMSFDYRGRVIDFRDATLPSSGGEALAMRVLDAAGIPPLEDMFPAQPDFLAILKGLTQFKEKRGGLVIVSGNTGSGKSSTLYTLELSMPRDRINLVTVENPMEFTVPFARQYQINPLLNQKMADIERDLLRQDPDAVMVGEVRDSDSARTVFNMAESGHMCFTTTHTKNPVQTLHRMMSLFESGEDKERAAYILAQFIQVILSQKLIRRLCSHCRIKAGDYYEPKVDGCQKCKNKGYKGRVLVHDSMIFTLDDTGREELYQLLLAGHYDQVQAIPGIKRYTRGEVAMTLCRAGLLSLHDAKEMERL